MINDTFPLHIRTSMMRLHWIDLCMCLLPEEYDYWLGIANNPTIENIHKVRNESSKRIQDFINNFKPL